MATKTFKIGEYCKGGIITIETTQTQVKVIAKEWDFSKGTRKGSDQKNAKEFDRLEVSLTQSNAERKVDDFLNDLTTSYYSGVVLDWIKTKVTFNQNSWDY